MFLDKDDPRYYDIQNASKYIYAIGGTLNIIVNEEVKDALVRENISNMELTECFGCTKGEFDWIWETDEEPTVHFYKDK